MKFSEQWLRELSGTARGAREIADELTLRAYEVEEIVPQGAGLEKVVVGEVLAVEPHPDADRLRVARVDVGAEAPLQIVCGAPNLATGQKVPVALVGAALRPLIKTPTEKGFVIRKSKIRGVESCGMICAEDELGLGDDHEGIMVLPEDAPVGESFAAYMGLDDTAVEIDILPNRAHDSLSHEGVAREIAAIEGRAPAAMPSQAAPDVRADADVDTHVTTEACPRYTATLMEGVDNTVRTPQWMAARLRTCGLRSVSPLVDITNYVMLETGQPLHVFDADAIARGGAAARITVRAAHSGEKMTLLDGTEIALDAEDIVIASDAAPIALAGVMGGADSGASAQTTRVIVEVAAFDAATIRRTRVRHRLTSDAAFRFERDLDPNLVAHARNRAVQLITEICGGRVAATADHEPAPVAPWTVTLAHADVERLLGTRIAAEEIVTLLGRIGITVAVDGETLTCTIPTVRRDVRTPADVIEEIGRLYGYEKIAPQPLPTTVAAAAANEQRAFEHRLRDLLVAGGFDEIKSYAFYGADDAQALGLDAAEHVALRNPVGAHLTLMRRTLIPGAVRGCAKNLTHAEAARVFEIGRTYVPQPDALPREHTVLALAAADKRTDGGQFYDVRAMVDALARDVGVSVVYDDDFATEERDAVSLHAGRRALIRVGDNIVGLIGEVPREAAKRFGIKRARVAVAELDVAALRAAAQSRQTFASLPKYPTVQRDLSMIVGARTRVADVERVLSDAGGALLRDVDLFDLYVNPQTQERSMAFRLTFGAPDRTLTSAEVDDAVAAIIAAVEEDGEITVKKL